MILAFQSQLFGFGKPSSEKYKFLEITLRALFDENVSNQFNIRLCWSRA